MTSEQRTTYGGFGRVLTRMESRSDPFRYGADESLPPADMDLRPLLTERIGVTPAALEVSRSSFAYKCRELMEEFRGEPALLWLHGLLIANLRRRGQPEQAAPLFQRIWAEHGGFLIDRLNSRWLVSAVTTFGDHGATEVQRRVGLSMNVLFNTMKLYEAERLHAGLAPEQPFDQPHERHRLPLDMDDFSLRSGGLDVNMLGRLWVEAEADPVIAPLAHHLLVLLDRDAGGVFRRLQLMREAKGEPQPGDEQMPLPADAPREDAQFTLAKPKLGHVVPVPRAVSGRRRWGVVATVKAPLSRIARFAAWHLRAGAERVTLYLDAPEAAQVAWLSAQPGIEVVPCDAAYWEGHDKRPRTHQQRQMRNATHCYERSDLDWLAHIDVDEFLLTPEPLGDILARIPSDIALARLAPVEQLADTGDEALFKTTARRAGHASAVLEEVYPTFGMHLRGGFISHLEGKVIARTGLPRCRLGIHALLWKRQAVENAAELTHCHLAHAHAPDWESFLGHLDFRLDRGSYRKQEDTRFRLNELFTFLRKSEGEEGLRLFFEEVCTATPDLVARLEARDMLVRWRLDLDAAVAEVFDPLPEELPGELPGATA
ncbi:glycosyltransferase family 2 protein [Pseudooceanicola nanhaiensis]|uniref:glycosyltransferase family 2 protein n=1 Tax=Pseudooceanicola nanhaiensis TaxID=375761 RepID=UPI001CD64A5B|nr:glycosyltransferase family 2 protein [Pseudooceanicola nanhaiensis]MCA0921031.1 glycosyltransferase family 2 protein [Pseudooceanicola nanhaiensis]